MYTSNDSGVTYVDTMALDGETNLKEKTAAIDKPSEDELNQIR